MVKNRNGPLSFIIAVLNYQRDPEGILKAKRRHLRLPMMGWMTVSHGFHVRLTVVHRFYTQQWNSRIGWWENLQKKQYIKWSKALNLLFRFALANQSIEVDEFASHLAKPINPPMNQPWGPFLHHPIVIPIEVAQASVSNVAFIDKDFWSLYAHHAVFFKNHQMEVSKIRGSPKSSILQGFSLKKTIQRAWENLHDYGNLQMTTRTYRYFSSMVDGDVMWLHLLDHNSRWFHDLMIIRKSTEKYGRMAQIYACPPWNSIFHTKIPRARQY